MNLINSFYTSVFLKKNVKKINTEKEKKKIHVNSAILLHCSNAPLFSEQCSMVELRAVQESNIFLLFIFLHFARNLLWDPCTVNSFFFFVNQTFASCVFEKTQTLARSQTDSMKKTSCP